MELDQRPDRPEKPVRVGVFDDVADTNRVVQDLLDAGFTSHQITVISSDKSKEQFFSEYDHHQVPGETTAPAVATGGAVGGTVGAMTALAVELIAAGVGFLAAGVVLIPVGVVVGIFVGAMMTQGIEKEAAQYYGQAVTDGRILVAAEAHGDQSGQMLAAAERIFVEAGAEPIQLLGG